MFPAYFFPLSFWEICLTSLASMNGDGLLLTI